jgi:hypothetical protein
MQVDRNWKWARAAGLALMALVVIAGSAAASPASAIHSAVQSAIQSARDDVQRRLRQQEWEQGGLGQRDAAVASCIRRFRSYDPHSMTYRGYDGLRRRCP